MLLDDLGQMGRDVDGDVDLAVLEGATRTASSGIGLKTTVLILGSPRQWLGTASITISSSFAQRTNL